MRKHLFLTGMMGSGKSTMGRLLAARLGVEFVDLDDRIEAREGMRIPEIFAQKGEEGFRNCETQALRALCAQPPCVVATGGGSVLRDENVSLMRSAGVIVLLDRPLEEMIRDVREDGRPNLAGGKEMRMKTLYAQREVRYRLSCDVAFDNRGTPEEAVERLMGDTLIYSIK